MKIVALQGSPKLSGNTAVLVSQFASGAHAAGADVDIVNLMELEIHPCDACDLCECGDREACVHNDSMRPLMQKIKEADAVILATPVWWTGMSSHTKLFLDRLYGYKTKEYLGGKGIFLITTYYDTYTKDLPIPGADIAEYVIQSVSDFAEMEFLGHLRAAKVPGKVFDNPRILDKAFKEGKNFANVMIKTKNA